jgi:Entner-Doudoroff aldolase
MQAQDAFDHVQRTRIIAILRGDMHQREIEIVDALVSGGITAIEVSVVSPDFAGVIRRLEKEFGGRAAIGAGTVLTQAQLSAVAHAGACFVVSPNTNPAIISGTHELGMASFPGAYTATEIVLASQSGADAVKVFPAVTLGPTYIKALRGPLPETRLIPTGGIHLGNMADYFAAGSFAVGIGSELVGKSEMNSPDHDQLLQKAAAYAHAARKRTDG